jgi:hypothetical protein
MVGAPNAAEMRQQTGWFSRFRIGTGGRRAWALDVSCLGPAMIELPLPAYAGHISPAQLSID